jgi:hypothetical protein
VEERATHGPGFSSNAYYDSIAGMLGEDIRKISIKPDHCRLSILGLVDAKFIDAVNAEKNSSLSKRSLVQVARVLGIAVTTDLSQSGFGDCLAGRYENSGRDENGKKTAVGVCIFQA